MTSNDGFQLLHGAVEAMPEGVVVTDVSRPDNPIVYCNRGFERLTGYRQDEILNRNCRFIQGPETDPATIEQLRQAIRLRQAEAVVLRNYRKDGTPFWNALSITPMPNAAGEVQYFVGVQTNITHIKQMEQQLVQSQKLEIIGLVTSGVAHDFNNLLTVINGFSELALELLPAGSGAAPMLQQIEAAGLRAVALTRQLLAFTRKQPVQMERLDLNRIISASEPLFRRLVGASIALTYDLHAGLHAVFVDPGQMEQVLWNLIVNARDAMPGGGTIAIRTRNLPADPGLYGSVQLDVSDTGQGMSEEVKARIFEPLFTTKPLGQGTGLGLATVQRIVQISRGTIEIQSELGQGTTFRLRFPGVDGNEAMDSKLLRKRSALRGTEIVLVVDDDPDVRSMMIHSLRSLGYTVLEADRGETALRVWESDRRPLDLVISDVAMPGMPVGVLRQRLAVDHPAAKLLLVSGYLEESAIRDEIEAGTLAFLAKPFTASDLAAAVRDTLSVPK